VRRTLLVVVSLAVPLVLIPFNVRLLATAGFLGWEYGRPHFPPAPGFTDAERLALAVPSTRFILRDADPTELARLTHAGRPLYAPEEIAHLVDVQRFVARLTWLGILAAAAQLLAAADAWRRRGWAGFASALARGGWWTIGAVVAIGGGMAAAWPWVFTRFHMLFFAPGTWQFPVESGLIRLFPGQFWYDTAVVLAGLTAVEALALIALGHRTRRAHPHDVTGHQPYGS